MREIIVKKYCIIASFAFGVLGQEALGAALSVDEQMEIIRQKVTKVEALKTACDEAYKDWEMREKAVPYDQRYSPEFAASMTSWNVQLDSPQGGSSWMQSFKKPVIGFSLPTGNMTGIAGGIVGATLGIALGAVPAIYSGSYEPVVNLGGKGFEVGRGVGFTAGAAVGGVIGAAATPLYAPFHYYQNKEYQIPNVICQIYDLHKEIRELTMERSFIKNEELGKYLRDLELYYKELRPKVSSDCEKQEWLVEFGPLHL